jgi:multiple sugar transport system substrate-binding protein
LNDTIPGGFKVASTGDDGKLYFVPFSYYAWGVHYRKSLFEENGWTVPTNLEELTALAEAMKSKGVTPFAFANDGRWPAMGTFDQLNFRLNGYQFHVDLMAGKEKWTDERVKSVFTTWESMLPLHQENPNGRTWQEAAQAVVSKEAGMMTIGNFIAQQFPAEEVGDLDFFPFPALNPEFGIDTVEAPIDGYALSNSPKNDVAAREFLNFLGTAAGQQAYLSKDPSVVATSSGVDPAGYNALQTKAMETVSSAKYVTQFLDRDTLPEFASNVAGPAFADFIADPSKIDSILEDMQGQAEAIFAG